MSALIQIGKDGKTYDNTIAPDYVSLYHHGKSDPAFILNMFKHVYHRCYMYHANQGFKLFDHKRVGGLICSADEYNFSVITPAGDVAQYEYEYYLNIYGYDIRTVDYKWVAEVCIIDVVDQVKGYKIDSLKTEYYMRFGNAYCKINGREFKCISSAYECNSEFSLYLDEIYNGNAIQKSIAN